MNKKYLKDFILLIVVIVFCSIAARILAGGETLEEYAKRNPSASGTSSEEASILSSSQSKASDSVSLSSIDKTTDSNSSSSLNEPAYSSSISSEAATSASSELYEEATEQVFYQDGFYYEPISNDVFKRISGVSYPVDCTIPIDDLRYVVLQYVDFNGESQSGEMICNKSIAQDIVEIFYELYHI